MYFKHAKRWLAGLACALGLNPASYAQPQPTMMLPATPTNAAPTVILPATPTSSASTVILPAQPVTAAPAVEEKKEKEDDTWHLMQEPIHGFKMTGWLYGTGNYNFSNASSRYNGPWTTNDQEGGYLNQLWLNIKRDLTDEFNWGANIDVYFGNDYLSSQSRGFENRAARGWLPHWNSGQDYGLTIPQAYVEAGTKDFNVRAGHFYTPIGYMTVQPAGNFFNTLPYGFMMTNPFTHWGVMGQANVCEDIQFTGALVNGWDALDRPTDSIGFLGGMKITFPDKKGYWSTYGYIGQEPENRGTGYSSRTLFSTVFDYNLTEQVEFVLEGNYGWQKNAGLNTDDFYNIAPYLFVKLSDTLKVGVRYEYFWDPYGFASAERVGNPNNGPIPANVTAGPYRGKFQTIAAGLNWTPLGNKNLIIRPEVRYDWFNGQGVGGDPFSGGNSDHQIVGVLGAIVQF